MRQQRLEFRETFFESDLKLDRSLLTHAEKVGLTSAEGKKLLQAGVNYIEALAKGFGKELQTDKQWYDAYDALLKDIQRARRDEAIGLRAFLKADDAKKPAP